MRSSHVDLPTLSQTTGACGSVIGDEFWSAAFSKDGFVLSAISLPLSSKSQVRELSRVEIFDMDLIRCELLPEKNGAVLSWTGDQYTRRSEIWFFDKDGQLQGSPVRNVPYEDYASVVTTAGLPYLLTDKGISQSTFSLRAIQAAGLRELGTVYCPPENKPHPFHAELSQTQSGLFAALSCDNAGDDTNTELLLVELLGELVSTYEIPFDRHVTSSSVATGADGGLLIALVLADSSPDGGSFVVVELDASRQVVEVHEWDQTAEHARFVHTEAGLWVHLMHKRFKEDQGYAVTQTLCPVTVHGVLDVARLPEGALEPQASCPLSRESEVRPQGEAPFDYDFQVHALGDDLFFFSQRSGLGLVPAGNYVPGVPEMPHLLGEGVPRALSCSENACEAVMQHPCLDARCQDALGWGESQGMSFVRASALSEDFPETETRIGPFLYQVPSRLEVFGEDGFPRTFAGETVPLIVRSEPNAALGLASPSGLSILSEDASLSSVTTPVFVEEDGYRIFGSEGVGLSTSVKVEASGEAEVARFATSFSRVQQCGDEYVAMSGGGTLARFSPDRPEDGFEVFSEEIFAGIFGCTDEVLLAQGVVAQGPQIVSLKDGTSVPYLVPEDSRLALSENQSLRFGSFLGILLVTPDEDPLTLVVVDSQGPILEKKLPLPQEQADLLRDPLQTRSHSTVFLMPTDQPENFSQVHLLSRVGEGAPLLSTWWFESD